MNKVFRVVDSNQAIHEDKTGIHKEAVRTSLNHSVKDQMIKTRHYTGGRRATRTAGSAGSYRNYKSFKSSGASNDTRQEDGYSAESSPNKAGESPRTARRYSTNNNRNRGNSIGGASAGAPVAGTIHTLINPDKSGMNSTLVNDAFGETVIKKMINATASEAHQHKVSGTQESKGIIRSAGRSLSRGIQSAVVDEDQDMAGKTRQQASKYGYRAGKYSVKAGKNAARGAYRFARYSRQLSKEVRAGNLTGKEANILRLRRGAGSLYTGMASIGKVVKAEAVKGVQEFEGSDDLGIQAFTKSRDAILKTKRTVHTGRRTAKSVKTGVKGTARMVQKSAIKVQQAAKYIAAVARKAVANPVFVKAAGLLACIIFVAALVMSVASAVSSIIPAISLKSEDKELTKTYKYVTELDARLTKEIQDIPKETRNVDQFHYYVNGYEVNPASIVFSTEADLILLFFDTKYDDYAFDKWIYGLFGGTNVQSEVDKLHNTLYNYTTERWKEEIEHTGTDENGESYSYTETIWHLDVNIHMESFSTYLNRNIDTLLSKDEQSRMEALQTVGVYTVKKELGNPFKDKPWGISSRFGWRLHPISGELSEHNGIDIAMEGGTPINNVLYGKVTTVAYDENGYGNYVVVTWGEREVLYAHMSSVAVSAGQTILKGDIVGYVGSTGSSTGNHLHIEYKKKGYLLNPQFYLDGATAGAGIPSEGYSDLIAYAEQYLGLPYLFGGSAPPRFDCSGFICWVYTNSGTRNLPRTTAQGIYNQTTPIRESEAQPGDLVFFHNTYDSPNPITHVGIYVGNGQMLHAGDPIQYTSFHTSYWQKYNPVFGRLK